MLSEAVANVQRLYGSTPYDLGAGYNIGSTLGLVQGDARRYQQMISEGKGWSGNPESTMTAAYPRETVSGLSRSIGLPQLSGIQPLPLPEPEILPPIPGGPSSVLPSLPAVGGVSALPQLPDIGLPPAPDISHATGDPVGLPHAVSSGDGEVKRNPVILPVLASSVEPGTPTPSQMQEQLKVAKAYEQEVTAEEAALESQSV